MPTPNARAPFNGATPHLRAPPRVPQDRCAGARWPHPAGPTPGRGSRRRPLVPQVGHPDLPRRRAAAPGPVRPQARRAEGSRRAVEADPDQRDRHPDLRGPAAPGEDHGQARPRPVAGRQPGRPRRHPGVQRAPPAQADARRRVAAVRLGGGETPGGDRPRRAAVRQPVLHLHARPVQRARSRLPRPRARPVPRDGPDPRRHGSQRRRRSNGSPTARHS